MVKAEYHIKKLIDESDIAIDSKAAKQLIKYLALLEKWNSKINLTSSTQWPLIGPLFNEGMRASVLYTEKPVFHLDIGSGAGFPAIILRILRPNIQLDLVESIAKKCAFLETLVYELELSQTRVYSMRLNEYLQQVNCDRAWDCVSWKALKLRSDDLMELLKRTHRDTQFWMFHGRELAVKEPKIIEQYFKLLKSNKLDDKRMWALSVYLPK